MKARSSKPELPRIRRGLGSAFIAMGALHALTALVGLGGRAYFLGYLLFVVGSLAYLLYEFNSTRIFYYEVLADFLVGLAALVVLMTPVTGLILIAYGLGLRRGRMLGFFHAPPL